KKTGTGTTVDREELSRIPNSRDPWAALRTVPGVQLDRVNQSGSESGQQSGYIGKGSVQTDSMWVLDGVVITDPAAVGASPTYFDFDAFDEIAVTTGGSDVRVATGGVGINLVTKRGTNRFRGNVGGFLTHDDFQASNVPDELASDPRLQGNDKADHVDQLTDYGADLGGPIIKDKLWFWGSYGKQDLRIVRFNQVKDKTILKDYSAKLNFQAAPNNMFSAFWFLGAKEKFGRPNSPFAGLSESPEHARTQGGAYPNDNFKGLWKFEDNHVFGPSFMMNLKYSYYGSGFFLTPSGGRELNEYVDRVAGIVTGAGTHYQSTRPQHTANADFNYFRGSHEFRFGFAYRKASVKSTSSPSGNQVRAQIDTALGPIANIRRETISGYKGSYTSFYLADTYTRDRLTINLGARMDIQKAENEASTVSGNATFPEILPDLSYDGSGDTIEWTDISPRFGITYALDEKRNTLLRGSFAMFTNQLPMPDVTAVNPVGGIGSAIYGWNDVNADRVVQPGEVDFAGGLLAPPVNTELSTVNDIDDDYSAPRDMEFIVGVDHQLPGNVALSASYTYRKATRAPYAPFIGVNGTDWVECAPTSARGFTTQTCFDLGPENAAALEANNFGSIATNRPDYSRRYQGIELTVLKRLADRWSGRVSFGYNDWTEHFDGTAGIQDPNASIYDTYGLSTWGSHILTDAKVDGGQIGVFSTGSGTLYWVGGKWQFSANALYQLPAGFEIAGNLYGRQGYLRPVNITLDTFLGDTVLGTPTTDSQRLPNVWNLDLRLAKNFNFGNARLGLTADVFNVFNSNTTLRQVDAADSSAFNRIDQIMNPLIARFGVRLSF
ncbi:MAG TPA: TonB-dependent receptor plug domain-containing protein, partial [Vicinamibacteria bacterium]